MIFMFIKGHGQETGSDTTLPDYPNTIFMHQILLETALPYSLHPPLKVTMFTKNRILQLTQQRTTE